MATKLLNLNCPEYQFDDLDVEKVGNCIDDVLIANFGGKNIVLRGTQSEKHDMQKEEFVSRILSTGTDRFEHDNNSAINVNDKPIDLFGYVCKVEKPISARVLNGFHTWKPMSLEKPQRKVDVWMIYDAEQLENVEYFHSHYKVLAHDGYVFKNPNHKTEALLGVLVIN